MSRPWLPVQKEIGGDAERAFIELNFLWNDINLDNAEKLKRLSEIRQELLNFWKEKVKKENLHVLKYKIGQVRTEIESWWEKCFLSEDEKQEFEDYSSTNYSDLLYQCHVNELERLKRKFYRNESLFLLIKKHQDTWRRVVNVDKQLYNPERLFQNRGAHLLQEERDRRAAQKDLPQLEEQIKRETALFEREHGRPFLVYGKTFSDIILEQKEQHKENQKSLKSAKKKSDNETAPVILPKATSLSKLKRKLDTQSPLILQTKQARIASCDKLPLQPVKITNRRLMLPVRRKLIDRAASVPVVNPSDSNLFHPTFNFHPTSRP